MNSKIKEVKEEHPSNIDSISVTLDVSNFLLSIFIKDNLEQSLNIAHIIATIGVSKSDKSIEVNSLQFSNIPLIFVVKSLENKQPVLLNSIRFIQL